MLQTFERVRAFTYQRAFEDRIFARNGAQGKVI